MRPGAQLKPHGNTTVNCINNSMVPRSRKLRIDPQRSTKLAQKLHAHSVQYAHKLTSTRHAIENKNTHYNSGALELHATRNPPYLQQLPSYPLYDGFFLAGRDQPKADHPNNLAEGQPLITTVTNVTISLKGLHDLIGLYLGGRSQPQADQLYDLADVHPLLITTVTDVTIGGPGKPAEQG
eukprot:1161761-Pelagomonas_calceolata.AAC.14